VVESGLPAALVLVALICSSTFLAWKGIIPSHVFFMIAGAAITWAVPKAAQIFSSRAKATASEPQGSPAMSFTREEIPTKPDIKSEAVTEARPKFEKKGGEDK
jgi:hypothetical protein